MMFANAAAFLFDTLTSELGQTVDNFGGFEFDQQAQVRGQDKIFSSSSSVRSINLSLAGPHLRKATGVFIGSELDYCTALNVSPPSVSRCNSSLQKKINK